MEDKLRWYVEGLFEETPPTKKAVELKEELIQNLQDKYKDLLADGKTPEAAYNIVVAGIGDVSSLLKVLEEDNMPDMEKHEAAQRKSAMLTSIAVMMYILSVLPLIILSTIGSGRYDVIGLPILFIMVAAATGLLIYNNMTKPRYYKQDDSMVEEFREWQSDTHETKQMRRAISSALWSVIVVLYFIISFTTRAWHISWVIFIIGGALESLINLFITTRKR